MTEALRPKILVWLPAVRALPGMDERLKAVLRNGAPEAEWVFADCDETFFRHLPESRAAVVWEFEESWLEKAPRLVLISTPAAGRDWIRVQPRPGLTLAFGTFHGELIGETVLGLVLAFSRGIRDSLERQRSQPWGRAEIAAGMRPVRGSRAVIAGFGNIGQWIGRYLKPLDVRLTGVSRSVKPRPDYFTAGDEVLQFRDLDRILPETDHLILALPGGPGTDRLLDARRLDLLPRRAVVYNIGRGNAVDEEALAERLRDGRLAGAGLDVFAQEPLPENAGIRTCPNVILMPHVSAFAPNYLDLYSRELLPLVRMHVLGGATGDSERRK